GPWVGRSDTETLLEACDAWGLRQTLRRANGMFALALWDRRERELHLVRDRVGIKPLVWGRAGARLVFASTLDALRAFPGFDETLDRDALGTFFRFSYVPAPRTIFRSAFKVEPGTWLTFRGADELPSLCRWWDASALAMTASSTPFEGGAGEAVDELEAVLKRAVKRRLVADVPVGAFLSGGVDSSTVVSMARRVRGEPLRTYSIGNEDPAYDEGATAAAIAEHLGTEHVAGTAKGALASDLVRDALCAYDEPFADSSQLPTFLVSRLARADVTVSLSGDGGDELFGGYNRHVWASRLWRSVAWCPLPLRRRLAASLASVRVERLDALWELASPPLPALRLPGMKLHKLADVAGADSLAGLYEVLQSAWRDPLGLVPDMKSQIATPTLRPGEEATAGIMLADLRGYLPNDILTKVDRASMAVSLEARVPLLDHEVIEFAWRLPRELKVVGTTGKWILRELLARHVPRGLWDRPKLGFGIPMADWLRGPLREWAEELLRPTALSDVIETEPVLRRWHEHQGGGADHSAALWAVLCLQAWRVRKRPSLS
ncbi:MAG: asparagine synthase (glutamine-hydrolyzing), partial [Myxococcota bacterium]